MNIFFFLLWNKFFRSDEGVGNKFAIKQTNWKFFLMVKKIVEKNVMKNISKKSELIISLTALQKNFIRIEINFFCQIKMPGTNSQLNEITE